jgi:hypothetical protein
MGPNATDEYTSAPTTQRDDRVTAEIDAVLAQLERWGAERAWIGPDPYEGLNTPLGRWAPGVRGRQAVVQAYKRLPTSPPWPLRAPPKPNSKTLALALSAYASTYGRELPSAERFLSLLPAQLDRLNLLPESGGWGYHFDLQTRHLLYFGEAPNVIATTFVVGSLIDAFRATGDQVLADRAIAARRGLLTFLSPKSDTRRYFMYVADGSRLIHNANVLACGTLARLHELQPDPAAEELALECLRSTTDAQQAGGHWPYGESSNLRWQDNFHTAYVLQGLFETSRVFAAGTESLERGLRAWRTDFFGPDGEAFYYPDRRFPLEAHSYASAIDLLCATGTASDIQFADRVASAAIRQLWLPREGRFAYRRTKLGLNQRLFVRWTNAPMFRALCALASKAFDAPP